jgi:hypothetical protein
MTRGQIVLCLAATLVAVNAGCGGGSKGTVSPTGANAGARIAASPMTQLGAAQSYTPIGHIVADSGFRPQHDGFSFENYPPPTGLQDLTPAEMVDLFGPQVCASGHGAGCVLTPPAQVWMAVENHGMQNGHCFGFSVTSLMLFQQYLNPLDYGAPSVPALSLTGNFALQERIAESFVLQVSPQVQSAEIKASPNDVLDFLIKALGNPKETYTLGVFNRNHTIGHAITPYAVEDRGDGIFALLVYDNNYPNITRAVIFNRKQNTWGYEAAPNPSVRSVLLDGDANSNPLELFPTSAALGVQPCPFCAGFGHAQAPGYSARAIPPSLRPSFGNRAAPASLTPGEYEEISLTADTVNHGHLLMTDTAGHRTGFVNGKLVNEIPGARVITPLLARNFEQTPEPQYRIPREAKFTISLDGSALQAPDAEAVSVIGPGYSAVASNIDLHPGQREELELTRNGTLLAYRNSSGPIQLPHLELGLQRPGSDYRFAVSTPPLKSGSALTAVAQPVVKRLSLNAHHVKNGGKYSLAITQLRRAGGQRSKGRAVRIRHGGSAHLALKR